MRTTTKPTRKRASLDGRTSKLIFNVRDDAHRGLRVAAAEDGVAMGHIVERLVLGYLESRRKRQGR